MTGKKAVPANTADTALVLRIGPECRDAPRQ